MKLLPIEPGCLVMIIGAHYDPRYIGKVGIAKECIREGIYLGKMRNFCCHYAWVVYGDGFVSRDGDCGFIMIDPKHLMRIDGDPQEEKRETRITEKA